MAAAHEHAGVEGIAAEDPVELVPGVVAEFGLELRLVAEEWGGHAGGGGE